MTDDADIPCDLQIALENTPSEMSHVKPLDLVPPEQWPDCPACGDRLSLSSVAVQDALSA